MHQDSSSSSSTSTSSLVDRRSGNSYFRRGIGGAGNYCKLDPSIPAIPQAPSRPDLRSTSLLSSGIGGAGNIHFVSEKAFLSQEEELARSKMRDANTPLVYHYGIGGAGNRASREQAPPSPEPESTQPSNPGLAGTEFSSPASGADSLIKKLPFSFGSRKLLPLPNDHSTAPTLTIPVISSTDRDSRPAQRYAKRRNSGISFLKKVLHFEWIS
ncbi:MAG: hypothetical protein M1827_005728 [Pycnora praestabilis]|nr:MAG: hypothetical protein M1827_005728 [Pycnora praestabilis]